MRKSIQLAILCAVSIGMMASAAAVPPATPCTPDNEGEQRFVPDPLGHGGDIYQCINERWERVAVCDDRGNCIWI